MFKTNQWKRLFFCDVRYENFPFNQKASVFVSYVTNLKNWFMLFAVRISRYGCTWEVWRAFTKLELLSCSPNFPRAAITRHTHAKHEQIRNFSVRDFDNAAAECIIRNFSVRPGLKYVSLDAQTLAKCKACIGILDNSCSYCKKRDILQTHWFGSGDGSERKRRNFLR